MIILYNFSFKLEAFLELLNRHFVARMAKEFPTLEPGVAKASINGKKYTRIYFEETGGSKHSRYFVRVADGAIFACNGWKVPNLNRQFGTLDTISEFEWGGYEGVALPGSSFVMKTTSGPYATAVAK